MEWKTEKGNPKLSGGRNCLQPSFLPIILSDPEWQIKLQFALPIRPVPDPAHVFRMYSAALPALMLHFFLHPGCPVSGAEINRSTVKRNLFDLIEAGYSIQYTEVSRKPGGGDPGGAEKKPLSSMGCSGTNGLGGTEKPSLGSMPEWSSCSFPCFQKSAEPAIWPAPRCLSALYQNIIRHTRFGGHAGSCYSQI